jgi:hypothetical protein
MQPMTVRQVFYQATVRGLVEKSECGYDKVQVGYPTTASPRMAGSYRADRALDRHG